ncbi:MAG TPA: NUDIX domain-containing protein [Anaerolineales bacterium]|nr:NUDIX domain-containing protein [Anaerolineales bacterium]HNN13893.1 NUDIX domain-containing protein [Anaerolineales bacterium]
MSMRNRAGIILIEGGQLALIERHKQGRHYFAFPGGGVDEGETDEQAAIREAEEELGIRVEVLLRAAEVHRLNRRDQIYFLVRHVSGEFGTGNGEEYSDPNPLHGTYQPIWMPVEEILVKNVVPRGLAEFVYKSHQEGWKQSTEIIVQE